eukprot:29085-Pelagococcus_subviridis.AAC.2
MSRRLFISLTTTSRCSVLRSKFERGSRHRTRAGAGSSRRTATESSSSRPRHPRFILRCTATSCGLFFRFNTT